MAACFGRETPGSSAASLSNRFPVTTHSTVGGNNLFSQAGPSGHRLVCEVRQRHDGPILHLGHASSGRFLASRGWAA